MNILQIIDSLSIGGAEMMAINISNLLQESGHKVTLVSMRESNALEKKINDSVNKVFLKKKSFIDVFAFFSLLKIIKRNGIKCIHAHSSSIYWTCLVKIFYPHIKIIWHDHFGRSEQLHDNDRLLIKILSHMFDIIISVNQNLKNWSIRNTNLENKFIFKLNNFAFIPEVKREPIDNQISIINLANFRGRKTI